MNMTRTEHPWPEGGEPTTREPAFTGPARDTVPLAYSRADAAETFDVDLATFEAHVLPHLRTVKLGVYTRIPAAESSAFSLSAPADAWPRSVPVPL
jgi:hypothetical protein